MGLNKVETVAEGLDYEHETLDDFITYLEGLRERHGKEGKTLQVEFYSSHDCVEMRLYRMWEETNTEARQRIEHQIKKQQLQLRNLTATTNNTRASLEHGIGQLQVELSELEEE